MSKTTYVYYQPNDKDLKDNYGDCSIRALLGTAANKPCMGTSRKGGLRNGNFELVREHSALSALR